MSAKRTELLNVICLRISVRKGNKMLFRTETSLEEKAVRLSIGR